jgi:hypothetical protein
MINFNYALTRFASSAETIAALARSASEEQARWKPVPDEWSILEVLCHLYDEEREDFRTRVRLTLENPEADWPPINPRGWVTERGYNQREWPAALEAWAQERRASLQWLRELQNPNWDSTHTHPQFGSATAGEMLAAWVAHDHLHIRQLNQLHWQWLALSAPTASLEYAGGW